jgi:hypothetical protein
VFAISAPDNLIKTLDVGLLGLQVQNQLLLLRFAPDLELGVLHLQPTVLEGGALGLPLPLEHVPLQGHQPGRQPFNYLARLPLPQLGLLLGQPLHLLLLLDRHPFAELA